MNLFCGGLRQIFLWPPPSRWFRCAPAPQLAARLPWLASRPLLGCFFEHFAAADVKSELFFPFSQLNISPRLPGVFHSVTYVLLSHYLGLEGLLSKVVFLPPVRHISELTEVPLGINSQRTHSNFRNQIDGKVLWLLLLTKLSNCHNECSLAFPLVLVEYVNVLLLYVVLEGCVGGATREG